MFSEFNNPRIQIYLFSLLFFLFAIFQKSNNHQLLFFLIFPAKNPGQDFGSMNTKENMAMWWIRRYLIVVFFAKKYSISSGANKAAHQISSDYRFRQACSEYDRCVPFTWAKWEVLKGNFIVFVSGSNFPTRCFFGFLWMWFLFLAFESMEIFLIKKCHLLKE